MNELTRLSQTTREMIARSLGAYERVSQLTVEEAKAEYGHWLFQSIEGIINLGAIVRYLTEKGEDLAGLGRFWTTMYLKVGHGQIVPELIRRFQLRLSLLNKFSNFALPDQELLASGELVKLALVAPDGTETNRKVDPMDMSSEQISQAFAKDHIRSIAEQSAYLDQKRAKAADKTRQPDKMIGNLRIDVDRGGVVHRREFIPADDIIRAAKLLQKAAAV